MRKQTISSPLCDHFTYSVQRKDKNISFKICRTKSDEHLNMTNYLWDNMSNMYLMARLVPITENNKKKY